MVTKIIAKNFYWISGFVTGIWGLVMLLLGLIIGYGCADGKIEEKKKPVSYNSYIKR